MANSAGDLRNPEGMKGTGQGVDLRTVGVSTPLRPVCVDKYPYGENNDGLWYSVLVARVTPNPAAGSGEIRLTEPAQATPVYPSWSPDGKSIAYNLTVPNGRRAYRQICLLHLGASVR